MSRIAHTTNFSSDSELAFRTALAMSLLAPERFDILHVKPPGEADSWDQFPGVRDVLQQWGRLPAGAVPADIETQLGLSVRKAEVVSADPVEAIGTYFKTHLPHLLVMATHGRTGVNRWLQGSFSQDIVERTDLPALLLGPHSRSIIDAASGRLTLARVLMPVVAKPDPKQAAHALEVLFSLLQIAAPAPEMVHILGPASDEGLRDQSLDGVETVRRDGDIGEAIAQLARERGADLIVMPTSGRHSFLDAVRGSTTNRVVAGAASAVLTLPLP